MHFSKTYQQLLLTLPAELRDSAIEYRKLKKLINQVVRELTSLGLSPETLHEVLQPGEAGLTTTRTIRVNDQEVKVIYELGNVADHIEPRLRLLVESTSSTNGLSLDAGPSSLPNNVTGCEPSVEAGAESHSEAQTTPPDVSSISTQALATEAEVDAHEVIIPLVSDTAFFELLTHALELLTTRLAAMRHDFEANLHVLSRSISFSARPMSAMTSFRAYSAHSSDAAAVSVSAPSHALFHANKSDLYAWREIFQLYVEAEIFESHQEASRGERSIEDAEKRLSDFLHLLEERGHASGREFKVKESREALQTFIQLNTFILDLRKFQHATAEATRKILKKHAKRTALPLTPTLNSPFFVSDGTSPTTSLSVILPSGRPQLPTSSGITLSLLLGQAIGENILPIIPHIDDYACLICTSIAFKPIRLSCGHLFCVRCLVKMQKRGQGHCPMCRAPTVLSADRSNVDWAMLNFMKDWFPVESRKKLRQNEKEVAEEELQELGIEVGNCVIM